MMVCAHGNVAEYCKAREMEIVATWDGEIIEYNGKIPVLVTDSEMSETEYYYLKGVFLARGYELISTRYKDNKLLSEYLVYSSKQRTSRRGGRQSFGDRAVIQRILELRAAGKSLRVIQADEGVRNKDGSMLSISPISKIIKNEIGG